MAQELDYVVYTLPPENDPEHGMYVLIVPAELELSFNPTTDFWAQARKTGLVVLQEGLRLEWVPIVDTGVKSLDRSEDSANTDKPTS